MMIVVMMIVVMTVVMIAEVVTVIAFMMTVVMMRVVMTVVMIAEVVTVIAVMMTVVMIAEVIEMGQGLHLGAEIETDDIEGFKKVYVVRKFHYVCQLKMRFLGDFSYLSAV